MSPIISFPSGIENPDRIHCPNLHNPMKKPAWNSSMTYAFALLTAKSDFALCLFQILSSLLVLKKK